jgi:hypothetical protein
MVFPFEEFGRRPAGTPGTLLASHFGKSRFA